jgi:hypothetical protein
MITTSSATATTSAASIIRGWSRAESSIGDLSLESCNHGLHLKELLGELLLFILGLRDRVNNFGEL